MTYILQLSILIFHLATHIPPPTILAWLALSNAFPMERLRVDLIQVGVQSSGRVGEVRISDAVVNTAGDCRDTDQCGHLLDKAIDIIAAGGEPGEDTQPKNRGVIRKHGHIVCL